MQSTLPSSSSRQPAAVRKSTVDFVVIWLIVSGLTALALFAAWQFWHTDRIFTGVKVAGVPVGGITQSTAMIRLNQHLHPYPMPSVSVSYEGQEWTLSSAELTPQPDLSSAINEAFLVGRDSGILDQIVAQSAALIGAYNVQPALEFDQSAVRYQLSQMAEEVRRPGRAAAQVGDVTVPSRPGLDVDVDTTAALVLDALQRGETATIPLQVMETTPPDAAAPSTVEADNESTVAARQPVILRHSESGLHFALDRALLAELMPSGDVGSLDEERLRQVITLWAEDIYLPAQDARLRFDTNTNQAVVVQPSVTGRQLNVEKTVTLLRAAFTTGDTQITLPLEQIVPQVDSNQLAEMGIRELVASGTTYFAGSSAARIRNIEVAAEKFEGVVIPPNGIFSFNSIVEDVSAANGFEDSLIIWGDRTAVGVGGGVCQVSTTVFRAAMNAGFPIVERYNHGYVVSWYGEPGMDATIYTPTVDLKFRNDTNAHLLIQPVVDAGGGAITFQFYGTKPNRQVTISDPIITEREEPGPPVYREDGSLAAGETQQVEYAKDGMTVTVERTVTENGETRTDTFVSKYVPWKAEYLVGPGTEVPATPTPAPESA